MSIEVLLKQFSKNQTALEKAREQKDQKSQNDLNKQQGDICLQIFLQFQEVKRKAVNPVAGEEKRNREELAAVNKLIAENKELKKLSAATNISFLDVKHSVQSETKELVKVVRSSVTADLLAVAKSFYVAMTLSAERDKKLLCLWRYQLISQQTFQSELTKNPGRISKANARLGKLQAEHAGNKEELSKKQDELKGVEAKISEYTKPVLELVKEYFRHMKIYDAWKGDGKNPHAEKKDELEIAWNAEWSKKQRLGIPEIKAVCDECVKLFLNKRRLTGEIGAIEMLPGEIKRQEAALKDLQEESAYLVCALQRVSDFVDTKELQSAAQGQPDLLASIAIFNSRETFSLAKMETKEIEDILFVQCSNANTDGVVSLIVKDVLMKSDIMRKKTRAVWNDLQQLEQAVQSFGPPDVKFEQPVSFFHCLQIKLLEENIAQLEIGIRAANGFLSAHKDDVLHRNALSQWRQSLNKLKGEIESGIHYAAAEFAGKIKEVVEEVQNHTGILGVDRYVAPLNLSAGVHFFMPLAYAQVITPPAAVPR